MEDDEVDVGCEKMLLNDVDRCREILYQEL